mmetsp:Transcript_24983/g.52881  ORF Transcript_24983/g.52881 Transcript_24983/m.52881 type:complete len:227 (+) Transcript_24983:1458-2138(+)
MGVRKLFEEEVIIEDASDEEDESSVALYFEPDGEGEGFRVGHTENAELKAKQPATDGNAFSGLFNQLTTFRLQGKISAEITAAYEAEQQRNQEQAKVADLTASNGENAVLATSATGSMEDRDEANEGNNGAPVDAMDCHGDTDAAKESHGGNGGSTVKFDIAGDMSAESATKAPAPADGSTAKSPPAVAAKSTAPTIAFKTPSYAGVACNFVPAMSVPDGPILQFS